MVGETNNHEATRNGTTRCLSLEQIHQQYRAGDRDIAYRVGGKAWGLVELSHLGMTVPNTIVLCNVQRSSAQTNDEQTGSRPQALVEFLDKMGDTPLAVRSSAIGEDGSEASFAGQYESVLNVSGSAALHAAIDTCVLSVQSTRAQSYLNEKHVIRNEDLECPGGDPVDRAVQMNVVVQEMVDADFAGVLFTADPHSARRDVLVIDAVKGLGEALVSGEATPDHYAVDPDNQIITKACVGQQPFLSDDLIVALAQQARHIEAALAEPLDLEWAIDHSGKIVWLQARPITTLPADLNEFDTPLPQPDNVLTISNIGEMMPGAVCPMTGAVTGWGIDYGLQHMQRAVGARSHIDPEWQITVWAYGHLFLNLSGNVLLGAAVLGSNAAQTAQTLCGREVPELRDPPAQPLWRRVFNTGKLLHYCITAPKVVERFDRELARFSLHHHNSSEAMLDEITQKLDFFNHTMAVHIQSSALSGFYSSIVENMVSSKRNASTEAEQAEAVRLLSGAQGVESAQMVEQLDTLIDTIAGHPHAETEFLHQDARQALAWLRKSAFASAFDDFLARHGHRGYRELCLRDPAWEDAPEQLIASMQAGVAAKLIQLESPSSHNSHEKGAIDLSTLSRSLRWALPKAHAAIRSREHTKSRLVQVGHVFQHGFAHLGRQLMEEGKLPDADLVYFFVPEELPKIVRPDPETPGMIAQAIKRREALPFASLLEMPEVSVGHPRPLTETHNTDDSDMLQGRPASRGVVEGIARVAISLSEAASLQPGEILVTPITDIGWTPYFSVITGLVTDLGSSVSHGAVIAREYGLPCVVNTRTGTKRIRTGDKILLDGNRGRVSWID